MNTEIEKKFFVKDNSFIKKAINIMDINQSYITITENKNIRIRIIDNIRAYLTIKYYDKSNVNRRQEFEYEIPIDDAVTMALKCDYYISKTRYIVPYKHRKWEVDVFKDRYDGLIIAEIELQNENEKLKLPKWIGDEITDPKYSNCNLALNINQKFIKKQG